MSRRGAPTTKAVDEAMAAAGLVRPRKAAEMIGLPYDVVEPHLHTVTGGRVEVNGRIYRGPTLAAVIEVQRAMAAARGQLSPGD